MIDVQDIQRVYGGGEQQVHALKDISLQVAAGEFLALKGRSGSGKTTLLNCIGGLDQPTAGMIRVDGEEVTGMDERARSRWRLATVGFIFQAQGLLPSLSAYENVELGLRIAGVARRERKPRALAALEQVGLSDYVQQRPYELSGGQAQRVAIARALAVRPKIILADEATGELDTATSQTILRLFQTVAQQGTTILLATHDDLVEGFVDRVVYLADGKIGDR
jgi:putative ABC transport system ATP-binding protein